MAKSKDRRNPNMSTAERKKRMAQSKAKREELDKLEDPSVMTALKLRKSEKEELSKIAEERGTSFSALLREGGRLLGDFDPFFLNKISEYSTKFGIKPSMIIQNLIIKQLAYEAAEVEVYGSVDRIRNEFVYTDEGPITGTKLFEMLKGQYVNDLDNRK